MKRQTFALVFTPLILLFVGLLWITRAEVDYAQFVGRGFSWLPPPQETVCNAWEQVNDGGFGMRPSSDKSQTNPLPFLGEESFELAVYNDQLYVGMEATNALGARLWRTKASASTPQTQDDWEEVIADEMGRPWGIENINQVDHIDSLAGFNGFLYASSANSKEPSGTRIFRSPNGDPGSWEDVLSEIGPGFGNPNNENFKDMLEFEGQLCGGTWNEDTGAEVWCSLDGTSWEQKNRSGFGDPNNSIIWSSEVFNGSLYFGVQHKHSEDGFSRQDEGRIYRANSLSGTPDWELVFEGKTGSIVPLLLGESGGMLFAATFSQDGIEIWKSPTGENGSWIPTSRSGMSGSRLNTGTNTDGAVLYNERLHVAVSNPVRGFRVWRYDQDGIWRVIGNSASYSDDDISAQLATFQGHLFAWSTNYASGQSVLQTDCSVGREDQAYAARLSLVMSGLLGLVLFAFLRESKRKQV